MENTRQEVLSDKMDIHFFELKKIKKAVKHKPMEDWLNLINAETEGELMDVEATTKIKEVKESMLPHGFFSFHLIQNACILQEIML